MIDDNHYVTLAQTQYIKQLREPLHHALCALILLKPLDPIDFIANYLKYWIKHVRLYRRRKIAQAQIENILDIHLPWNVKVIAEQAKRLEQNKLDEIRRLEAEKARKAALEQTRIRQATDAMKLHANKIIISLLAREILANVIETATDRTLKKYEAAEKARKKAEKRKQKELEKIEEENDEDDIENDEDDDDDDEEDDDE